MHVKQAEKQAEKSLKNNKTFFTANTTKKKSKTWQTTTWHTRQTAFFMPNHFKDVQISDIWH